MCACRFAGRLNAPVRKAIQLQARAANICSALGSRFSGEQQGISNEPFHRAINRHFKLPGGLRKMELLTIMQQIALYTYNGEAPCSANYRHSACVLLERIARSTS